MADIRRNQGRLQEAHERSKTVTRSEEMKGLREQMQVRPPGVVLGTAGLGVAVVVPSQAHSALLGCMSPLPPQQDINAVSKAADTIKKRLAELDRSNEQVRQLWLSSVVGQPGGGVGGVASLFVVCRALQVLRNSAPRLNC